MRVVPTTMHPAARSRVTRGSSRSGRGRPAVAALPCRSSSPATAMLSFTATGTPARATPRARIGVEVSGLGERGRGADRVERVELGVEGGDAIQVRADDVDRTDPAGPDAVSDVEGGEERRGGGGVHAPRIGSRTPRGYGAFALRAELPALDGVHDGRGPGGDPELRVDVLEVGVDRLRRDTEPVADRRVGQPGRDEVEHAPFPTRQNARLRGSVEGERRLPRRGQRLPPRGAVVPRPRAHATGQLAPGQCGPAGAGGPPRQ